MLAPARPALYSPEAVRVHNRPPRNFQEIAIVEGDSVAELQTRAAAVGANGLIYGGVVSRPGPVLGVGVGTSTYGYGRNSAVAVDTGVGFGIPTSGGSALQATAVYVPGR